MNTTILLALFGLLILLEGAYIILFPINTIKILNKIAKNKNNLAKLGLIEIAIGIIIILLSILIITS